MITEKQFEKLLNQNISANTDSDGLISSLFASKYLGCTVKGFNDNEKIYVEPDTDYKNLVYMDTDIVSSDIVSIGQHIIASDDISFQILSKKENIINANFDRNDEVRSFTKGYTKKFPGGTIHFLIYLMEKFGYKLDIPDLYFDYEYTKFDGSISKVKIGEILTRPDGLLFSSFFYTQNVIDWLSYYSKYSPTNKKILDFIKYCLTFKGKTINNRPAYDYFNQRQTDFMLSNGADDKDGGFETIINSYNQYTRKEFIYFNNILADIFNFNPIRLINEYSLILGEPYKCNVKDSHSANKELNDKNIWGYAFTSSPTSKKYNLKITKSL